MEAIGLVYRCSNSFGRCSPADPPINPIHNTMYCKALASSPSVTSSIAAAVLQGCTKNTGTSVTGWFWSLSAFHWQLFKPASISSAYRPTNPSHHANFPQMRSYTTWCEERVHHIDRHRIWLWQIPDGEIQHWNLVGSGKVDRVFYAWLRPLAGGWMDCYLGSCKNTGKLQVRWLLAYWILVKDIVTRIVISSLPL